MAAQHARSVRLLGFGIAAVGYLFGVQALLRHGIMLNGGDGGGDVFAYWTAGGHLLRGEPIYAAGVGGYAAYLYPPVLAQLFMPLANLPLPVVAWIWRAVEVACLRIATGSWTAAGIAILVFPPVIAEIDAGNVHLLIAAGVAAAIRGRAETVVPVALTKFATLAAAPMALRRNPRALLAGLGVAMGMVLVSFALRPDLWWEYTRFATHVGSADSGWYNLGAFIPTWARVVLAIGAIAWSLRQPRAAALAATLALPVLWFHGLSVLVAVVATPGAPRAWRSGPGAPR